MKNDNMIIGEKEVLLINEHWVKYTPAVLLIIASWGIYALCLTLGLAASGVSHLLSIALIVIGHLILLMFHHAAFYSFFSATTWQTLVTNRRLLCSQQLLWVSDDMVDIPIWRIRSVEVRKKGAMQHILNYGSLILNSGALPTIERVPHPHKVHARLVPYIQGMQPAVEKEQQNASSPTNTKKSTTQLVDPISM